MLPTRPGPRRTLRRVKHLQVTNEVRRGREIGLGQSSNPNGMGFRLQGEGPRTPLGTRSSLQNARALRTFSVDGTTQSPSLRCRRRVLERNRVVSESETYFAARECMQEPSSKPIRSSTACGVVSSDFENENPITTFVMLTPESNRSVDSYGFRTPFQRDPSPPPTPTDADSMWHEKEHGVESHVQEIRNHISRLLNIESSPRTPEGTREGEMFPTRRRSIMLESSSDSFVSEAYSSSDRRNNTVEDESMRRAAKIDNVHTTMQIRLSEPTQHNVSTAESERHSLYIRTRRNSSVSMISMLTPTATQNQSSPIVRTMTARLFISGSRVCRKLASRIPIFDIFKRRTKNKPPSVKARTSSEASTLCAYVENLSYGSDGRNPTINTRSHVESIWSVERDETVGVSSRLYRSAMSAGDGMVNTPESSSQLSGARTSPTQTTGGTAITSISSKMNNSKCDRYLRLCGGNAEDSVRLPTAGYYEDPDDPNSYYRPDHTESDIENDVPTPPSGRCFRPSFYTTLNANSSAAAFWLSTVRGLSLGVSAEESIPEARISAPKLPVTTISHSRSVESFATAIRRPSLRERSRQPWGLEESSSVSILSRTSSASSHGYLTRDDHIMGRSGSEVESTTFTNGPRDINEYYRPSHNSVYVPFRLDQGVCRVVGEEPAVHSLGRQDVTETCGSSLVVPPQAPLEKVVETEKTKKVQKKQSWFGGFSLKIKRITKERSKRDSGYSTDRGPRPF